MNRYLFKMQLVLVLVFLLSGAATARTGTLFRAYLSVNGSDSNPCTLTAPCRLLPAALAATQAGGEVWMLDSANYNTGTVTIGQSVTILAVPGALGSLVENNEDVIDIPVSNIVVTLRNLVLRSYIGGIYNGVYLTGSGTQLIVEESEFSGLDEGIRVNAPNASVKATRSTFRGLNTFSIDIVGTNAVGTSAKGVLDHCTITNSAQDAIYGSYADVAVSHTSITNSNVAVHADTGARIVLEDNMITHDTTGAAISNSGTITTNGNNTFAFLTNYFTGGAMTIGQHF